MVLKKTEDLKGKSVDKKSHIKKQGPVKRKNTGTYFHSCYPYYIILVDNYN